MPHIDGIPENPHGRSLPRCEANAKPVWRRHEQPMEDEGAAIEQCAICLQLGPDTRLRESSSLHRCIYGCEGPCSCKAPLCDSCADARWGAGTPPPLPPTTTDDDGSAYRELPDQQGRSGLSVRARVFGLIVAVVLVCYVLKHKFR